MNTEFILKEMKTKVGLHIEAIGRGKVSDWSEYRFQTGLIHGMELCIQFIEDEKRKEETENE
jgi:hypothetical protein